MTTATQPLVNQETINRVMKWLIVGNCGLSSKCMVANIMSQGVTGKVRVYEAQQHPLDSSDFNRCSKLLHHVPELREHLSVMRPVSEYWEVIVDHWEELENLLNNELSEGRKDGPYSLKGSTYKRMKELYAPIDDNRYIRQVPLPIRAKS